MGNPILLRKAEQGRLIHRGNRADGVEEMNGPVLFVPLVQCKPVHPGGQAYIYFFNIECSGEENLILSLFDDFLWRFRFHAGFGFSPLFFIQFFQLATHGFKRFGDQRPKGFAGVILSWLLVHHQFLSGRDPHGDPDMVRVAGLLAFLLLFYGNSATYNSVVKLIEFFGFFMD